MRWFPYLPPVVLAAGVLVDGPAFGLLLALAVLLAVAELGRRYRHE